MDTKKRALKKKINHTARGVLFYNVILVGVTLLFAVGFGVYVALNPSCAGDSGTMQKILERSLGNYAGVLSIAGVAAGLLYLGIRHRKNGYLKESFVRKKGMTPAVFGQMACVFMSLQVLFIVGAALAEIILNQFGYSLQASVDSAASASTDWSMFLYVGLVGPIAEELVYRGIVMQSLMSCGKGFAVGISALLFGVMHGNFPQGLFAVAAGVVFGYIASEYSIRWSIALHILNNVIFSEALGKLAKLLPETAASVVEYGTLIGFAVLTCVIFCRKRDKIASWWRENRPEKSLWFSALSAVWMILFFIMEFFIALNGIKPVA